MVLKNKNLKNTVVEILVRTVLAMFHDKYCAFTPRVLRVTPRRGKDAIVNTKTQMLRKTHKLQEKQRLLEQHMHFQWLLLDGIWGRNGLPTQQQF